MTQPPTPSHRNIAIDRARTFLTVVVVIHHAVIPYTYYGHTDPKIWIGFDAIILANDSYFMAMFFLLSGLFVWPSLTRRAPGTFIRDRVLRLGLPFVIGALTVIPIAYYALEPRTSTETFAAYWVRTVTIGPWFAGPIWFTWILLAFGLIAFAVYRLAPHIVDPIDRLSRRGFTKPWRFFIVFLAITALAYVPSRVYFGPNEWFALGPIAVQKSRVLLYAIYFAFGIGIGAANLSTGLLSADGVLRKQWFVWSFAVIPPYAAMWGLIAIKREVLGNPSNLPHWYELLYGTVFVTFSAAMLFAVLSLFLRFKEKGRSTLDLIQRDAYGIFLVHYIYVQWLSYWLFDKDLSAISKATIVFFGTLGLSWITSAALRQLPGANRVL